MYFTAKISHSKKGFVTIGTNSGYLRLGFPRQWFNGKQKYVNLGLVDTPENRIIASDRAQLAQRDYQRYQLGDANAFDWTLQKYKTGEVMAMPVHLVEIQEAIKLTELWEKWLSYKKANLKESTYVYLSESIGNIIRKLPGNLAYNDSLAVKNKLYEITTVQYVRRILAKLSECCIWGMKHGLVDTNPYQGMADELPKPVWQEEPKPNPFTQEEKELIIEAFKLHLKFKGSYNGSHSNENLLILG